MFCSLRAVAMLAATFLSLAVSAQGLQPPRAKPSLLGPGLSAPATSALAPAPATAAAPAEAASAPAAPSAEKEAAGKLAANGWLVLLDRRDWGTAWDGASALFRKNVPLGSWMDAIPKVREPFGALVDRQAKEVGYKNAIPGHPIGDYVTVIFASKSEKKAEVQEVVTTVREADGRWRVTGYSAR